MDKQPPIRVALHPYFCLTEQFKTTLATFTLQGDLDHSEPSTSKDACLQSCKNSPGCGWYSYNAETTICLEFATCNEVDSSSTDFISGQVSCEITTTIEPPTTTMPSTTQPPLPDIYGTPL